MKKLTSLIINPGSTSTKIAVFDDRQMRFEHTIRHTVEEISKFDYIMDQFDFRKETIVDMLLSEGFDVKSLDFIMARGGILPPLKSGIYPINDQMLVDLRNSPSKHASNLAAIIADSISKDLGGIPAFIADPVVVDELSDVARVSGNAAFTRGSVFHALNQKAMARNYANEKGKRYEDLNLIVVHMGGGISVGVHKGGLVVDVNQAIDGEGPFSPERSGTLPAGDLVRACFSGKYTKDQVMKMINGDGGVSSYFATSDMRDVVAMEQNGDKKATLILDAMAYQIAKEIGAMATVLCGNVDAIILTGGIAYNTTMMGRLIPRIEFLAPVVLHPGEDELGALATAGFEVMTNARKSNIYGK